MYKEFILVPSNLPNHTNNSGYLYSQDSQSDTL